MFFLFITFIFFRFSRAFIIITLLFIFSILLFTQFFCFCSFWIYIWFFFTQLVILNLFSKSLATDSLWTIEHYEFQLIHRVRELAILLDQDPKEVHVFVLVNVQRIHFVYGLYTWSYKQINAMRAWFEIVSKFNYISEKIIKFHVLSIVIDHLLSSKVEWSIEQMQ